MIYTKINLLELYYPLKEGSWQIYMKELQMIFVALVMIDGLGD